MTERLGRADLHIHTLASDGTAGVDRRSSSTSRPTRARRHRDHRPRADRRGARGAGDGRGPRPALRGHRRRGGHDPRRPPPGPVRASRSSLPLAAARRSPRSTTRAASRSRPIRSCRIRCAPRASRSGACSPTSRASTPTPSRPSTRRPSGGPMHERVVRVRRGARPGRASAAATPTPCGRRGGLDDLPGPHRRRRPGGHRGRHDPLARHVPRLGRAARHVRAAAAQVRPRRPGQRSAAGSAATARAATSATPATRGRRVTGGARAMKIGLVTPYVYPLPGGVNEHVRHLYENLRLRGHDVRIISSTPRPAAGDRGRRHPHRQGLLVPANGSVGTLTVSPRYVSQVREVLDRERFDLLHFHEPFVPFLSLDRAARVDERERRHVPRLRRLLAGLRVRVARSWARSPTASTAGSRSVAAARHFIDRYFPGDYKVIPNGVDIARFQRAVPIARWRDGTLTSCSSAGSRPARASSTCSRRTGSCARPAATAGCSWSAPGPRSARRGATSRPAGWAASSSSAGSRTRRRRALQDRRRLRLAGHRPRVVRHRAARGDGRRRADRVQRHPRLQGRRAARARRSSCRRASRRPSPPRSAGSLGDDELRAAMGARARAGREFSWERVTAKVEDYYGFVIRRLAAQGALPPASTPRYRRRRRGRPRRSRTSTRDAGVSRPSSASRRTPGRRRSGGRPAGHPASGPRRASIGGACSASAIRQTHAL